MLTTTCKQFQQGLLIWLVLTLGHTPIKEPTLYEYYLDRKKELWIPWKMLVEPYIHVAEKKFSDILVPTEDSTRITWLLTLMNEVKLKRDALYV